MRISTGLPVRVSTVTLLFTAAVTALLTAATPTFWTVSSQADFLKGEVEGLSIDSDGRVTLGPSASLIAETAAPFLWTVVAAPDGTLFAGSGNEGKVLRIARDGGVSTFFDAAELEVHALALAPQGGLYVGTSPDGRIYRVAADGTSSVLFDPEDKYIWALATDKAGNVFAATGDKGVIYKITPDGEGARFYRTTTTNVVSLAFAPSGDLIAGTESPGRVFRLDPSGKPFVLLDAPLKEIHALRVAADGTIYAAGMSGSGTAGDDRPIAAPSTEARQPVATVSTEVTAVAVVESPTSQAPAGQATTSTGRTRGGRGALYRIRPDGFWDDVWETGDDIPYDLLLEPDGSVLVGTGTEGKIYRVSGEPAKATLLARAQARQITALLRESSGRIVGVTSNPGKLFALAAETAPNGTYESDVRDAGTTARWGVIRWRASGAGPQVRIATRSGNTATPDETWSAWSAAYDQADGQQITSPAARYLQFRATLSKAGTTLPVLTSVTVAYLPRNLRPEVASITVHPPGTVFQRPFSTGETEIAGYEDNTSDNRQPSSVQSAGGAGQPATPAPALGRRIYQKGLQTIVWKAQDENDDRLIYDVLYRREGDTTWRPMRRGVWDPIVVWDTTSVPDGTYLVKIVASDAPSNAPDTALTGEMESVTFDVDNSPPVVDMDPAAATKHGVSFTVRDAQSTVQRVEYSLDASRWRVLYPKDGIPDSRQEAFELTLEPTETASSVIIRATDAMNNVATAVAAITR
jgi:hypothetical protein